MISKRVKRDKATSNFARLGRYVLNAKTEKADVLWIRTAEYVMDTKGGGEKLASFRITNCQADTPGAAITQVQAVQNKNTRSKADKTYHMIVSFPDGERPTPEQLADIEDTLCNALGFGEHQRLSAVHQNTENVHIHITVNKVHPRSLRCVEPYNDYYTRDRVCRELERKHGLMVDNGMDRPAALNGQAFAAWVKETAGPTLAEVATSATSWQELHQVAGRFGLECRRHGAGVIFAQKDGDLMVKASSIDRLLSVKTLTARLGAFEAPKVVDQVKPDKQFTRPQPTPPRTRTDQPQRQPPGAAAMEAHQGEASFVTWVRDTARASLVEAATNATSWQELHQVAGRFGLECRRHGAGLVFAQKDGNLTVKASSIDRALSAKALSDRFGAFESPKLVDQVSQSPRTVVPPIAAVSDQCEAGKARQAGPRPVRRPLHQGTETLYVEFGKHCAGLDAARQKARSDLRTQARREDAELRKHYAERKAELVQRYKYAGPVKKEAKRKQRALAEERRHELAQHANRTRARMVELTARFEKPTWQAFLQAAAAGGDAVALAALRSRDNRRVRVAEALLTAENADQARAVVFPSLKPRVMKNGALVYRVDDGGVVSDEARQVRVTEVTAGAAFLALSLAAERFAGKALQIDGTAEFKAQIARLAAIEGLNVKFSDPAMEVQRHRHAAEMAENATASPALRAYVEARNHLHGQSSRIDYHRVWTTANAGPVVFIATGSLTDGTSIAILKQGNERLIMPVTPAQAAKLNALKSGKLVEVDRQGNIKEEREQTR